MSRTASFFITRWTLVHRARGDHTEARAALSDLCAAYYAPVVAFLQREGRAEDAARELAHSFFEQLLRRGSFTGAEPAKGRFRNYLLGALKHFTNHQRERAQAAKRGGGHQIVAWHGQETETGAGLQIADSNAESPDKAFDRQWALTVLDRALAALEKAMTESGKEERFTLLKPWLTGDATSMRQADVATALGVTEDAIKVMIHRLRKRFREAVKSEIAQTLDDPVQVKEELDCLVAALR